MSMISKYFHYLSFSILLLGVCSVFAQESRFIQGQLLDAKTGEPIVYATIRLKDKALGVISNQDGSFRIPQKFRSYGDILVISSMGYQKKQVRIDELDMDKMNVIKLQPGVMELSEAIVTAKKKRALSASGIVRRAIKAIPKNYPQHPFSIIGYYRDYQLNGSHYLNLNEAILEIFDKGFLFNDYQTTTVQIYDLKINFDFVRDSIAIQPYNYKTRRKVISNKFYLSDYGGNEFTIMGIHNPVRNYDVNSFDFVNVMKTDLLRKHVFQKEEDGYLNGNALYSIYFSTRFSGADFSGHGRMYISKKDFAIHKMEYGVYDNLRRNYKENTDHLLGGNKKLIFGVVTEYAPYMGKMYLNYISFRNRFKVKPEAKFQIVNEAFNVRRNRFELEFNRAPNKVDALGLENYKVLYNRKVVQIKRVELLGNIVFLYPLNDMISLYSELVELNSGNRREILTPDVDLKFKVKTIMDIEGNKLGRSKTEAFMQFREFFAQQHKPYRIPPKHHWFMRKKEPIFEFQPIVKLGNLDDYWMNTPLQNTEE